MPPRGQRRLRQPNPFRHRPARLRPRTRYPRPAAEHPGPDQSRNQPRRSRPGKQGRSPTPDRIKPTQKTNPLFFAKTPLNCGWAGAGAGGPPKIQKNFKNAKKILSGQTPLAVNPPLPTPPPRRLATANQTHRKPAANQLGNQTRIKPATNPTASTSSPAPSHNRKSIRTAKPAANPTAPVSGLAPSASHLHPPIATLAPTGWNQPKRTPCFLQKPP